MKIALISARIDPFISPVDMNGGCVLVRNYIKSLHRLGHDIHVFTRLDTENESNTERQNTKAKLQKEAGVGKVEVNNRLTIYRLPYNPMNENSKTWKFQVEESASFLKNTQKYIEKENFDIFHYFHLLSLAGWSNLCGRIPFLEKSTFSPLLISAGRKFEYLEDDRIAFEKEVIESMPIISCQSSGELEAIVREYGIDRARLIQVPLGVDTTIFYPKSDFQVTEQSDKRILISPNTLKRQKKQLEVVDIVAYLKSRGHRLVTIFIGRIREQEYFEQIVNKIKHLNMSIKVIDAIPTRASLLSVEENFVYIPGKKEKELAELIRSSDISVFPSTDEGFGLLNLDCMACGTLPICTKLSAYKDYLVNGENAIAIDVESTWQDFALELDSLLPDTERLIKLSKIAANSAQNFSWDNLIKKQLFVYNQLYDNAKIITTNYKGINWINLNDQ
ncbi:hypothetical protein A2473_03445 [candidate division WWE3 bacterium RIFOXYC2_FULL_42_13]|uniref:Glycosyltransferase n=1 Tax=candidate division WWE3 bacterium TaxID=2053526 RepID=A0A3D0ZRF0_UNCKA|nr:MAG: Glycogen synthase [Candidatus Moranbacteria bacterium GW2011_GWF2_36_839]OGC59349.1 MAG: hypothetical protein A2245_01590 [candidate division WWE3 bacterium RIFOXYA2_FULL_43_12]OGC65634.1 MAG: hypothetical protein A2274_02830 [candidate division WWE3 bacterium RIFOXYA12_FULL_43_11]OGC71546.1 MAG: hypothetical protein A2337_01670 [candidate division WWE3 bacterium RIFOXYB2_FULL_43_9]OGC73915.1 MAG: hypothetical protein A2473_03445 [candidate division WWE3 bacterium RIFOXYC2_FULL_42_13]O